MIKAIITDIEGTTTDIHFVHNVLFPYSRERIASYIHDNQLAPAVIKELNAVRTIIQEPNASLGRLSQQLLQWIDEDRKIAPLKNLQGLIWEQGFKTQAFKGHVYEDAYRQLKKWHDQHIKLYVYSSGSVQAQRLLFGFSEFGDLTPLFSGFFDTQVGAKREPQAYQTILNAIQCEGKNVLFLSDVIAELDAARVPHIQTALLNRDAAPISEPHTHPVFTTFNDITLA